MWVYVLAPSQGQKANCCFRRSRALVTNDPTRNKRCMVDTISIKEMFHIKYMFQVGLNIYP